MLKKVFPVEPVEDALSAALMNAGPVIHPPLILMNAGPLEHSERWDIHKEGTQPSIRRVTDVLDAERIAARVALGYRAPHFPLADHYKQPTATSGCTAARCTRSSPTPTTGASASCSPSTATCARMSSTASRSCLGLRMGRRAVPGGARLLALGSAVVGKDLRREGRTLENLGLASSRARR